LAWAGSTLALLAAATALLASDLPAKWLVLEDPPAQVDAAVVLAGDPGFERTTTAARMIRSGEARWLVLTGGEWLLEGDGAYSLRRRALGLGVPEASIRLETGSSSTREAMVGVLPILRRLSVRSVAVVTSPYHQRRAYLAARRAWPDLEIHNRPARPSFWAPERWWRERRSRRIVVSEYAKLAYYAVRGWI